jgi:hypothetical protein
VRFS